MATSTSSDAKQPKTALHTQHPGQEPKKELQRDIAQARKSDTWNLLTVIRIANAVTICTFFQPDEYYQALEPAWALAFGESSGAWITWEWRHQLRSSLHPILLGGVYKAISVFCDLLFPPVLRTKYLVLFPKVALAMQAVVMDYYTWALAEKLYGVASTESSVVLYVVIFSPWQWFVSTRAFSNTLETALTAMALYYWPWEWMKPTSTGRLREQDTQNLKWSIILAAFASVLRPTNLIIWAVLSLLTLPHANQAEFFVYIRDSSIFGSLVIGISQSADRWFYGTWTFPAANWLYFNLRENLAIFYGSNRLDYYFTEGYAWLLMPALPFALFAIYRALAGRLPTSPTTTPPPTAITRSLAILSLSVPITLSLIAHKEVRFIYPLFPMLALLSAGPIASFFDPFPHARPNSTGKRYILYLLLSLSILASITLGYIQNRGLKSVHGYLRSEFEAHNPGMVTYGTTFPLNHTTLGVLMPCHSIPWRSHLVYAEIDAWALTCEPPVGLDTEAKRDYLDEADIFYTDPAMWMAANLGAGRARAWPAYLMFFGQLEEEAGRSVPRGLYRECWRGFNSIWHDDWRRGGDVVVWCQSRGAEEDTTME